MSRVAPTLLAALLAASGCAHDPPPEPSPPPPPLPSVTPAPPPPAPPPPPPPKKRREKVTEFSFDGPNLKLPGQVVFETNSDRLSPVSDEYLEIVHDYLDAHPEVTLLRIEGHLDSDGQAAANQTLSEKRALAVARWLVAQGVKCERLIAVGFGHTKPVVPNDTPDNKAQNRRITFAPATNKGKPINGLAVDGGGKVAGDVCR